MNIDELNWRDMVMTLPLPLFISQPDGRWILANSAMDELTGEALGRPAESIDDLLDPEYHSAAGLISKAMFEDEPIKSLVKLIDGQAALLTIAAGPDDLVMGLVNRQESLTPEDKNHYNGVIRLIRSMGHDLNQPLTVAMGQTELALLGVGGDPALTDRLERILAELERIRKMFLSLSAAVHKTELI